MNQIAVTTPHGTVGRHVVAHLVRAGVRPRALTRDPGHLDAAWREHVDARAVDLRDADALTEVLEGVDSLYLVVPDDPGADEPLARYAEIGAAAARAVERAGVSRVVLQSSVGAEKRHGAGEIDGLGAVEELIETTGVSVTHLRCGFFMTNLLLDESWRESGVFEVLTEQPLAWVAPQDIGAVAAGLLLNEHWSGRRVQAVHGAGDLTWADAAAVLSEVTGQHLEARRIEDETMRERLRGVGMDDAQVEAIVGMSTGLREGFVPEQERDVTTTTPTTLGQWALSGLRPSAS